MIKMLKKEGIENGIKSITSWIHPRDAIPPHARTYMMLKGVRALTQREPNLMCFPRLHSLLSSHWLACALYFGHIGHLC